MDEDTIAAIATPMGPGGIGIVRISGPRAKPVLEALFRPAGGGPLENRRFTYGRVVSPRDGRVVDEAMAVFMAAPHTYTREDVAEIQCHGGPAVVRAVLELVLEEGVRLAEPGEFTRRAFLNGRIDLVEAEAVLDLATAQTHSQHRAGLSLLSGRLGEKVERIRAGLVEALAELEALIDYPDEMEQGFRPHALLSRLEEGAAELQGLLRDYSAGRVAREGARVVLAGRPNVGKSSLFNALVGFRRVIVSPVPGTTRDLVEETVELEGMPVVLVDTAGLRSSGDQVERQGIEMAWEQLERAHLVLFLMAADSHPGPREMEAMEGLQRRGVELLPVVSKADRAPREVLEAWRERFPQAVVVSATQGTGLEELRAEVTRRLLAGRGEPPEVVPTLRQKGLLEGALAAVERARRGVRQGAFPEVVALEVREACQRLEEITGRSLSQDLLDAMFSRFCLGK